MFFLVSFFVGGFIFLSVECQPMILDIIVPRNESRPREIEIDFETFLDKEKYFLLYIMQEVLGVGIGVCAIITTGTFLATIGKHFCAVYKIARF